ncbi:hypothetical protein DPMN_187068 [Dreissena polymorpha]|uniref:Uncharacterized protein n=1 Tax=Dreissena polymorpha TaxID=45954 RepID=A0A9D4DNC7_DREPO|nr:hypothetical protein DPMN_187068 [Dreissena polymorpha]
MNRYHTFSINHKQSTTQDRKTGRTCSLSCTEAEGYEVQGHENQQQERRQSEGYRQPQFEGFSYIWQAHNIGRKTKSSHWCKKIPCDIEIRRHIVPFCTNWAKSSMFKPLDHLEVIL